MIKLQAWRTTGKNPCVDPPVSITISPMGERLTAYRMTLDGPVYHTVPLVPWVLPLEVAIEMFGQETVGLITKDPQTINLVMHHPGREF